MVSLWLSHSAAAILLGLDAILGIGSAWCRGGVQEEMRLKFSVRIFENQEFQALEDVIWKLVTNCYQRVCT